MGSILVATGELSASDIAASLAPGLRLAFPRRELLALGSPALARAGYRVLADPSGLAGVGALEALTGLGPRRRILSRLIKELKASPPEFALLIDSPELNLPLARRLARLGVPLAWYIPPQEYLWGRTRLAKKIARLVDLVLTTDQAATQLYEGLGVRTLLTGHALADPERIRERSAQEKARGSETRRLIGLYPGSRRREIRLIAPRMISAAALIAGRLGPKVSFSLPLANQQDRGFLTKLCARHSVAIKLIPRDEARALLGRADLVITKAGTTTMEATLAGTPLVVVYRAQALTYWLATKVLRIQAHLPGIALPNIALGEALVPELIQAECTPEKIAQTALAVLAQSDEAREVLARATARLAQASATQKTIAALTNWRTSFCQASRP